jgi:predicted nucleotidyltransferase
VDRLRTAAQQLCAAQQNVLAVVLFGSLAQGTATPASDADLMVLLRADDRRILDRIPQYTRPFEAPRLGVQVLPWTEHELRRRLASGDRFAREVLETGVVLAGTVPEYARR